MDKQQTLKAACRTLGLTHTRDSLETILHEAERNGCSYLAEKDGEAVGTFAFIPSPEPTYGYIEGAWLDDAPYYVIHRIAASRKSRGLFKAMLDYCFGKTDNIRIDTHRDNVIMQHLLSKHGFAYCGIIYLQAKMIIFAK